MIVGVNFRNISVKKSQDISGKIQINNNSRIINVAETTIPLFKNKVAKIEFSFQTNYFQGKKKVGNITLEGFVLHKGKSRKILNSWKKDKKLIDEVSLAVMNSILRRCLIKGMELSEQVALPPPSNLPVMRAKKPQEDVGYIG